MQLGFRTSLTYRSRLRALIPESETHGVIGFGGTALGVGASSLAASYAYMVSQEADKRTLLVDADGIRPSQGAINELGGGGGDGLAEVLSGEVDAQAVTQNTESERLDVVVSGRWDSSERRGLGHGARIQRWHQAVERWRSSYDVVVIDLGSIADDVNTLRLAQHVDGVILVAEWNDTRTEALAAVRAGLDDAGANVLGAILNKRRRVVPRWLGSRS